MQLSAAEQSISALKADVASAQQQITNASTHADTLQSRISDIERAHMRVSAEKEETQARVAALISEVESVRANLLACTG